MADTNRICSKLDAAIKAYLDANGAGFPDSEGESTVYPGKRAANKSAPCTVVYSSRAVPEYQFCGRYVVDVAISVKSVAAPEANETEEAVEDTSNERVSTTFDLLIPGGQGKDSEQICTNINTAAAAAGIEITLFGFTEESQEADYDADIWSDTENLKVYCVPSIIS